MTVTDEKTHSQKYIVISIVWFEILLSDENESCVDLTRYSLCTSVVTKVLALGSVCVASYLNIKVQIIFCMSATLLLVDQDSFNAKKAFRTKGDAIRKRAAILVIKLTLGQSLVLLWHRWETTTASIRDIQVLRRISILCE